VTVGSEPPRSFGGPSLSTRNRSPTTPAPLAYLPTSSPCAGTNKRRGPRLWVSTWPRREHEAMVAPAADRSPNERTKAGSVRSLLPPASRSSGARNGNGPGSAVASRVRVGGYLPSRSPKIPGGVPNLVGLAGGERATTGRGRRRAPRKARTGFPLPHPPRRAVVEPNFLYCWYGRWDRAWAWPAERWQWRTQVVVWRYA
jgi:hypothetical protein